MTTTDDTNVQILQWIRNFMRAYQWAPSVREIGQAFGWTSASTAHKRLVYLEQEGLIERGQGNRQIKLTARGKELTV